MRNTNSVERIKQIFENTTPSMRYDGKEDFKKWQERAYKKLWELLGLDNMVEVENDEFEIDEEIQKDGHKQIHFTFLSEPGYYVPCLGLLPDGDVKGVVICIQGHSSGMHVSIGQPKFKEDPEIIADGDRDFARRAIKEGYAAICIEQRYMGTCGCAENGSPICIYDSRALPTLLMGRCAIGERVWDIMRLIDVLKTHFSHLTERIICLGNSGGGTATFYASCIDKRIDCSVPSCSVCTYKDSIVAMFHCCCNFVPNIAKYFDMGDIGGLIAPRPLVVVNGKEDPIFPEKGVKESMEHIKRAYKALNAEDKCHLVTGDGGHRFYADPAWKVINKLI